MKGLRTLLPLSVAVLISATQGLAAPSCSTFEVEVFSVDSTGELHPLFNFAQALKAGENWSTVLRGDLKPGELGVTITWDSTTEEPDPTIDLRIHVPQPGTSPALEGTLTLERMVWDSLFGPELFKTSSGTTLDLGPLGHPVAVVAVTPTKCARRKDR